VGGVIVGVLMAGAAIIILWVGTAFLRTLGAPAPEPPPPGELRRVRLRYRCPQCGMELRVDAAPSEEPVAPRHCMDEMDLVARLDD
jgi:hypothetical protein